MAQDAHAMANEESAVALDGPSWVDVSCPGHPLHVGWARERSRRRRQHVRPKLQTPTCRRSPVSLPWRVISTFPGFGGVVEALDEQRWWRERAP
jgi:hypothetical protein